MLIWVSSGRVAATERTQVSEVDAFQRHFDIWGRLTYFGEIGEHSLGTLVRIR